jgi:hypothetical protein
MLSITTDMKEKQGLNPNKWYEAVVVENDDTKHPDKMMLGRVQARIDEIFTGIPDKDLPWAVPTWYHADGGYPLSGFFAVPKKGSKVFLKFQDGNPSFPMYRGFHVDVKTQMEEVKHNYPDRVVARLRNKAMIVVDTRDNVCYIRNPGNLKIYIDGNAYLEINGSVDELVHGSVRRMIKGDLDETVVGDYHRAVIGNVEESFFGTINRSTKGTIREEHDGDRSYRTNGNVTESVSGNVQRFSGGTTLLESGSTFMIEGGPNILENCGNAQGDPHGSPSGNRNARTVTIPSDVQGGSSTSGSGTILSTLTNLFSSAFKIGSSLTSRIGVPKMPNPPRFYEWPGIPGSAKGTNERIENDKKHAAEKCPKYEKDTTPPNVNSNITVLPELPGAAEKPERWTKPDTKI